MWCLDMKKQDVETKKTDNSKRRLNKGKRIFRAASKLQINELNYVNSYKVHKPEGMNANTMKSKEV